jgi:hypothetical protein
VAGGRAGCQALMDELTARAYGDLRYAAVQTLAFDTYCMQHAQRYCVSAKSYAAHLTRLCCGLEYGGDLQVYAAIQKWLNGPARTEKPRVLGDFGPMTVADVRAADSRAAGDVEAYKRLVRQWAESVWSAYASQHELAHQWIQAALM